MTNQGSAAIECRRGSVSSLESTRAAINSTRIGHGFARQSGEGLIPERLASKSQRSSDVAQVMWLEKNQGYSYLEPGNRGS